MNEWVLTSIYRNTLRIWHFSAADRKIRPIDAKTGQTKRVIRSLEVGFSVCRFVPVAVSNPSKPELSFCSCAFV